MARKKRRCECPAGEKWAVPYADFLSLLLALFIALYALASVNIEKQKALKEEFFKIFNMNVDTTSIVDREKISKAMSENEQISEDKDLEQAASQDANDTVDNEDNKTLSTANLEEKSNGVLMLIPAQLSFDNGKADIRGEKTASFLTKLATVISLLPKETLVNIKGYAQDDEINGSNYKDALELSTSRANNVVRELVKYGVPSERLFSSGFGSNDSLEGEKKSVDIEFKTTQEFIQEQNIDNLLKDE